MRSRSGFTLVEMLIVLAISVLFSTIVILYGHAGQDTVALSVEEANISQLILKAKGLSINTYASVGLGCGDGVNFNFASGTYSLFVYSPSWNGNVCPSYASTTAHGISLADMQPYDTQSWQQPMAQGLIMETSSPNALADILFYPPDPATLISRDGQTWFFSNPPQNSNIYLQTVTGNSSATIAVSPTGQVSVQ
jgi:prepilin-type N-terminal cleavage/methylation domain-containing protein